MKQNLQRFFFSIGILSFSLISIRAQITENFDNVAGLTGTGWFMQNNSQPLGVTGWSQGPDVAGGGPFNSFNGATNAFISANFNNTTGGTGTISNWLVAPNATIKNGDVFTFYTRKPTIGAGMTDYPDRLEVRLSTNGASTNVGATAAAVGDFTTLLLSVNPTLVVGGYPQTWTQYTITISGLSSPASGRVAFRYYVTSAGPTGTNSDFIGIDAFQHTPYVCPTFTMTAGGALTGGTAGTAYSATLTQTGALGAPSFAVTAGALPPGLTLATNGDITGTPTATGTFNFTVTVSDASGCSGSQSYSITIVCPVGGASLSAFPQLCSNEGLYILSEGSPAGGIYSGTGVTSGQFDASVGSQTITYDVIDIYGCAQTTSAMITVNAAPTVSQTPFTAVCDYNGLITLSGGSPAGGTYSGTGVTGGQFDPASGTQNITYSYTDANGCSNNASEIQTVNAAPTVTQTPFTDVCITNGLVTLSGGSPSGGVYSGTGVSAGEFNPASGTQTITYTFTDGNGCSNSASQIHNVDPQPTVSLGASNNTPCVTHAPVTLTGTPSGGTYFGSAALTTNMFDPAVAGIGSHPVSYTFTDSATGCSDTAVTTIVVGGCAGIEGSNGLDQMIQVYPNPATDIISVSFGEQLENDHWTLTILTIEGKTILNKEFNIQGGNHIEMLNVAELATGTYLIKISNSKGEQSVKRMIKK